MIGGDQIRPNLIQVEAQAFYEEVYSGDAKGDSPVGSKTVEPGTSEEVSQPFADQHHNYVLLGMQASEHMGVKETVEKFVERYDVETGRVLEIGAGSGQLQDVVSDYTGLDIAASAARYFHKPFVEGSATDLPFENESFDSVWSVWTLEHIPNPERALDEMRRVTRTGGYLFLWPTWRCPPWRSQGYEVRPYSDFDWWGKARKLSVGFRSNPYLILAGRGTARSLRALYGRMTGVETRLRFDRLEPNFEHYWTPDADAVVSLDEHETMLWFLSRGDQCVNCPQDFSGRVQMTGGPLIIQVDKSQSVTDP